MSKPPEAQADDKDWTWVLDEACDECGADVGKISVASVAEFNLAGADRWARILDGEESDVRARPRDDVWSPLEYACHVRDVYRLFLERLNLMLGQENPTFPNWDPNITADAERYDLADPMTVSREVLAAAHDLARAFADITADQLGRKGSRSDGAEFTVESFARYELHDPEHHLWDVTGTQSEAR